MKRNFPDFLTAYLSYAEDKSRPTPFHQWVGVSVVSGALQRKVWLPEGKMMHYPNTFILLVGNPGIGKSVALSRGTGLLRKLQQEYNHEFHIMQGSMTEAGLCEEMNSVASFMYGSVVTQYSSGYFYASEASSSALQNLAGDFNATITELYDCADSFEKTLKEKQYRVPNPSLCVLAGSTFDFLKTIVNQSSVMGGLASRFIYVISQDKEQRRGDVDLGESDDSGDAEMKRLLTDDLVQINKLVGRFRITKGALAAYVSWFDSFASEYRGIESERMQAIITRKPTNLKKLMMILSASAGDSLEITQAQAERAIEMVEAVSRDSGQIISSAIIASKDGQDSVSQFILQAAKRCGGSVEISSLKKAYVTFGGDMTRYEGTIKHLVEAGMIALDSSRIKLLIEPDRYL